MTQIQSKSDSLIDLVSPPSLPSSLQDITTPYLIPVSSLENQFLEIQVVKL